MAEQAKFQKMLEVLLMLDCKYGRTIQEISERFIVSQRTVYRYFDTFKQVGFVIENNDGYFKIDKEESTAQDISWLKSFIAFMTSTGLFMPFRKKRILKTSTISFRRLNSKSRLS